MFDRQDAKDAKKSLREPGERLDSLARQVIGAAIEVHRHLGPGFSERVYEEALAMEFESRGIPFERQPAVRVHYKGCVVGEGRPDFVVGGSLVVEIKAVVAVAPVHHAQVISYLKALGSGLGLLLNFREAVMRRSINRVVWGQRETSYRQQKTREMNKAHEARQRFVISCGNSSKPFEVVKEDLDAVA